MLVLTVTPKEFSGFCEIKNVSKDGFLYCVRKPQLQDGSVTEGTVTTATGYIGSDTGSSPSHSQITHVSGDAAAGRSADARHDYNGREDRNGLYRY